MLRLGRQALDPLLDHRRSAREETVTMGIVGRPQDLVRTDILGQRADRSLDRFEGDPAVALEQLARPDLQAGIVEALVVEVPVHAVEPGRDPAAARFQEAYAQPEMPLGHATPDHA